MKKRLLESSDVAVIAAIVLCVAAVLWWMRSNPIDFTSLDTGGISYPAGTVTEVISEDLEPTPYDSSRRWGSQELRVRIEDGELAGQEVEIHNEVNDTHNIICEAGTRVVVRLESQEGLEPYFSIYNYNRGLGILGLVLVFAAFMVAVGRTKGLRSLIGLSFAIFLIGCFMLPAAQRMERQDARVHSGHDLGHTRGSSVLPGLLGDSARGRLQHGCGGRPDLSATAR